MPYFNSTVDSTVLYYRLYTPDAIAFKPTAERTSPLTLVFLHGWPMSSRMFDHLLVPLCETYRFRCIAPDRRGFGSSDWNSLTTESITFDTLVADLVGLLEHIKIGPFVFVGASMGAPESVLAYQSSKLIRENCRGFIWIGPNMPYSTRCDESPLAPAPEIWSGLLEGFRCSDGKQFIAEQVPGVFRADLNDISPRSLQFFERLVCQADPLALERMTGIFNRPVAEELKLLAEKDDKLPILILHGDSDAGMPLDASARPVQKMLPWSDLRVYEKAGHGLYLTHSDKVLDDMLEFLRGPVAKREA